MPAPGPAPKQTRARRNKSPHGEFRVVEIVPGKQPTLVDLFGDLNPCTGEPWSAWVFEAWKELDGFPSTSKHLPAQWRRLGLGLAYEEAAAMGKAPPAEGRQRIAKHFIDPDDLLRGRYQTVVTEEAESKGAKGKPEPKPKGGKKPDPRLKLVSS